MSKITKAEKAAAAAAPHPIVESVAPVETVKITVTLPRFYKVALLKDAGAEVARDLQDLVDNPKAAEHVVAYGLGRFNRDGATPDDKIRDEKGNALRDATKDERATEAVKLSDEKWKRLVAGTLRQRVGGSSDPVLAELRTFAIKALVKRNVKRSAIPKLPDRDAIQKALAAHAGLYDACLKHAEKIVEMNKSFEG